MRNLIWFFSYSSAYEYVLGCMMALCSHSMYQCFCYVKNRHHEQKNPHNSQIGFSIPRSQKRNTKVLICLGHNYCNTQIKSSPSLPTIRFHKRKISIHVKTSNFILFIFLYIYSDVDEILPSSSVSQQLMCHPSKWESGVSFLWTSFSWHHNGI